MKTSTPKSGFCQRTFSGVEGARVVVPAKVADEPLVAVDEFLAAELQRNGKLLVIADEDEGLVQIDRAVAFREALAGRRGVETFVVERVAASGLRRWNAAALCRCSRRAA